MRHQVTEIPEIRPQVTEFRLHALCCEACGETTDAPLPVEMPRGAFGPRLQAIVAICAGAYHLSKRNTQELLQDFFGVKISLGSISNLEQATSTALEPAYEEARASIRSSQRANVDETGWFEGARRCFLWTVCTPRATLFAIRDNRSQAVARDLLDGFSGVLHTDGYNAYHFFSGARRQFCWAHLIRQFRGLLLYDEHAQQLGTKLLEVTRRIFALWHRRHRKPRRRRADFVAAVAPLRCEFNALLQDGLHRLSTKGVCTTLIRHNPSLWLFLDRKGAEPTNNVAERGLRPAVLWRKRSFGTASPKGSRFAERILTAIATLRASGANVLQFLVSTCIASLLGQRHPSLLRA